MEFNLFKLGSTHTMPVDTITPPYPPLLITDTSPDALPLDPGSPLPLPGTGQQGKSPYLVESYGGIYDNFLSRKAVVANWKWYNTLTGEVYGQDSSANFHVWGSDDLENVALSIVPPDGKEIVIKALALKPQNDVYLQHSMLLTFAELAAVVALIIYFTKRRKKVGAVTMSEVLPFMLIGGGILAFSIIKKILEWLHIWTSKDTKDLDTASTDPGSFWSPNYWKTIKPANAQWTAPITTATAQAWISEIEDAFGIFDDCEECVIAVFKRCQSKATCSFLADVFQQETGEDLLTYLRGGLWPDDNLSDEDVNTISQYISKLPNY